MTELVVTGYASMDYVVALNGFVQVDKTTLVSHRDSTAWPRLGGCVSYVSVAAALAGHRVTPISWVGSDRDADAFRDGLNKLNISTAGIHRQSDSASPVAMLIYQADGSCSCLFDRAFSGTEILAPTQLDAIGRADHLCLTAGPGHLMDPILNARKPSAKLYWVLKNDVSCFTQQICERLSSEADVIFGNRAESHMIGGLTSQSTTIVTTNGTAGVDIYTGGLHIETKVNYVETNDPTGAGDTFAGGYIGALIGGGTTQKQAAIIAANSVSQLLMSRANSNEG
ncbi:MAG TPA: carbohydrate kinase family protein [Candidatus Thioglobus sp.]|jgi:ribokinase|nr:carbohydrate kinase family protein [Candidatus Thioglobus sp.]